MKPDKKLLTETGIALEKNLSKHDVFELGELSPYTCPECHGVLTQIREENRIRFRCHTGHAYSSDSLLEDVTNRIEESLWSAIRNVQESVLLLNHLGDHFASSNEPKLAAVYFNKAKDADERVRIIRQAVHSHEKLNATEMQDEAAKSSE